MPLAQRSFAKNRKTTLHAPLLQAAILTSPALPSIPSFNNWVLIVLATSALIKQVAQLKRKARITDGKSLQPSGRKLRQQPAESLVMPTVVPVVAVVGCCCCCSSKCAAVQLV
jgi:hypothetical protein